MPATAPLIFAIDGGGTRSRGRLFDRAGTVLGSAESGPCNPSTDLATALASTRDLWAACCALAGHDPSAVAAVDLSIGAAGLYVPRTRHSYLAAVPAFAQAHAMTDGYAALIGAGGGLPAALIITGTGVAGHRLYADGRSIQRDAWGWVAGDRGSGAWLGRAGLRHLMAAFDGLAPRDELARSILAAIGGAAALEAGWLRDMTPQRLAALAPCVIEQAEAGVPSALALRDRAISHLAALAHGLDAADVPLYLAGGLADIYRGRLAARLGRDVLVPEADALVGCWLVATGAAPPERAAFFSDLED